MRSFISIAMIASLTTSCGDTSSAREEKGIEKTQITSDFTGKRTQCYGVINGSLVNKYPEIVLLARQQGDYIVSRCTGTFVSEDVVLTAAHCVGDEDSGNMLAFIEDCAGGSDPLIVDSLKTIHHGFTADDFEAADTSSTQNELFKLDLAIIKFPKNTSSNFRTLSTKQVAIDDAVHFVGYGIPYAPDHSEAEKTISFEAIKKREGRNTITADAMEYASGTENLAIIYDRNTALSQELGKYSNIAQGDSGGPLFLGEKLVGITSSGSIVKIDGSTADIGFFTDLHSEDSKQLLEDAINTGFKINGYENFVSGVEEEEAVEEEETDSSTTEDPLDGESAAVEE